MGRGRITRFALLSLALLLIGLVVWQTASRMAGIATEHSQRQTTARRHSTIPILVPRVSSLGTVDADALLPQIVRAEQVDERALEEFGKAGNAAVAAAAYFVAGRYEFEQKRHDAAIRYMQRALEFAPDRASLHAWYAAVLMEAGRGSEAITQSEQAARLEPESADVQRILGLAYYDAGRLPESIEAWEHSLRIDPNDNIRQYVDKAKREAAVEGNFVETSSGHFVVRYEDGTPAQVLTDGLLPALERHYDGLSEDLGIAPKAAVTVILYNQEQFSTATHAPSWVGALNDGKLRLPLGDVSVMNPQIESVLRHELTHSFVHAAVRHCPVWLNEGLAQLEEPRQLSAQAAQLPASYRHDLVSLRQLEGPFTKFSPEEARTAYAESLAATEYLRAAYGMDGLRRLLAMLSDGKEPEEALRSLTPGGYEGLDHEVRAYLANRNQ